MCAKPQHPPHSLEETQMAGRVLTRPPVPLRSHQGPGRLRWGSGAGVSPGSVGSERPGHVSCPRDPTVPETGVNKVVFMQGHEWRDQRVETGLGTVGHGRRHSGRVEGSELSPWWESPQLLGCQRP